MKIESNVLKRLGPVPFWRGEQKCLDALEIIYRKAAEKAGKALNKQCEKIRKSR
ncbi:MAG: hypothetical protein IJJ51_01400 [Kiritimatiellae bacterium]|nr:hypothetical protein [Kiritimatiellia bacterium]